jgi:DNA-binding CsgD family transcriptional regulator
MRFQTNIHPDHLNRSASLASLQGQPSPELEVRLQLIARLPESDRQLLNLSAVQRLPHRQIATRLNLSPGTVTRQLHRLRTRLSHPVVRAIARAGRSLDASSRELAIDRFVLDLPTRDLCQKHHLNRHTLQSRLDHLTGWAASVNRREALQVQ